MSRNQMKEFYVHDVVYKFDKNKRIVFGAVNDSYEASSDAEDDGNVLQKGQIRVQWSNQKDVHTCRTAKVGLVNRTIIPGEVVRRLENGVETQRGYCKSSKETVAVQIVGTDKVIPHVTQDRLKNIRPNAPDTAVCLDDKFGRIEILEELLTLRSNCGSVVHVLSEVNEDVLKDYWMCKRSIVTYEMHYPGQELICVPTRLTQANWLFKSKAMKKGMNMMQRFTVQHVEDVMVEVAWFNESGFAQLAELDIPEIKRLQVLDNSIGDNLELNHRMLLKLNANDVLLSRKEWTKKMGAYFSPEVPKVRHIVNSKTNKSRVPLIRSTSLLHPTTPDESEEDWWTEDDDDGEEVNEEVDPSSAVAIIKSPSSLQKYRSRHYPPRRTELAPGHTHPVEIVFVESKVTVVWQDGKEEEDIPSTQLYFSTSLDDHEFFPGEFVMFPDETAMQYGVVQNVQYLERTASVKVFRFEAETAEHAVEVETKEMSVYDLRKHNKFVFRPGSTVLTKPRKSGMLGIVIDSSIHGLVMVRWLDNRIENCWPQDIELMPDAADMEFSDYDSTDNETQVSWETESIVSYAGDSCDETWLQHMAARLDFLRSRMTYLHDALKRSMDEDIYMLKDLLLIYDNSSYLDKLLGTSFFSLKSRHFQMLLSAAMKKAKLAGVELRGRLFTGDPTLSSSTKIKFAEKDNINKIIKLENKIKLAVAAAALPEDGAVVPSPDSEANIILHDNLLVEIVIMLKSRMDLAYAEIISRIGDDNALTVMTKALRNSYAVSSSVPLPSCPQTPDDSFSELSPLKALMLPISEEVLKVCESFNILEEAPQGHHYYKAKFEPHDCQKFIRNVLKEHKLLTGSLPPGVWVKTFHNRTDLLSVMIRGPDKTPYEDGLFLFDIQLSQDYPRSPPLVHYISFSSERLNPNLYVEGKVCVSLLGTWMGRGTEVWGPNSTLLQLIVSIQGLILVSEPYYNEAGYDKQTDTQQGLENSRTYNELVTLKLVQSMTRMLINPPEVFEAEIMEHFAKLGHGMNMVKRLSQFTEEVVVAKPDFALLPVSKGFKRSLKMALDTFAKCLAEDKQ